MFKIVSLILPGQTVEREFLIDIDPKKDRYFPDISEAERTPARGVLMQALEEITGRKQFTYTYTTLRQNEYHLVVLTLGRKFSRSKAWGRAYDHAHLSIVEMPWIEARIERRKAQKQAVTA